MPNGMTDRRSLITRRSEGAAVTADITSGAGALGRRRLVDYETVMCLSQHLCCILSLVTSQEPKRWLTKQGCTFETGRGGHLIVRRGHAVTDLPMHGKQQELGTGLVSAIKKQLGLK